MVKSRHKTILQIGSSPCLLRPSQRRCGQGPAYVESAWTNGISTKSGAGKGKNAPLPEIMSGIRARSADVASIRHDAAICCSRRVPPPAGSHFVSPDGLLFAPLPYGLPRVKAVAYIYETRRQRAGRDAGYLHFRLADRFAIQVGAFPAHMVRVVPVLRRFRRHGNKGQIAFTVISVPHDRA